MAQSRLTITVSRLLAPNYQPSVMSVLTTLAEAGLQLALSWLAAAVFKLPAKNNQKSVMPSVSFTLTESVLYLTLSWLAVAVFRLPAVNY